MKDINILLVDDDRDLSMVIRDMLEDYGYHVTMVERGDEAIEMLTNQTFQLILLDINLPDITGFELCKELRKVSTVPIIFASARTSEDDKINGYDIGGDDYIPKPYSLKELLAHVNAIIRRMNGFHNEQIISFHDIVVNLTARTVEKNGKPVSLSLREFDLLAYLLKHQNTAIQKDKIISEVWGAFSEVEVSTLTVHIRWLREKIEEDPANPVYIKTVWGVGYMIYTM